MALMSLFMEYSVEMAHPVPEGVIGGFISGGLNVTVLIFLFMFLIKEIGYVWMNYVLFSLTACAIPLVWISKEQYNRLNLDNSV